jgi:hypothetical protein
VNYSPTNQHKDEKKRDGNRRESNPCCKDLAIDTSRQTKKAELARNENSFSR